MLEQMQTRNHILTAPVDYTHNFALPDWRTSCVGASDDDFGIGLFLDLRRVQ